MLLYYQNGEEQLQFRRAIINLDNETGISIMKIVPKLDAGPVMMKSKIKNLKIQIIQISKQV